MSCGITQYTGVEGLTFDTLVESAGFTDMGGEVEVVLCSLVADQALSEGCTVETLEKSARFTEVVGCVEEVVDSFVTN